ncbi:TPA: flagellar hook-associated protein FlgK [Candidatus Poribacteria bacterium]|nr:flagellar hook-associated protein FlgK [Candidatus Poribacteria bacterium]HIN29198.1 flagellar hook-associated protein FlgK [Candidatus Poribacteria bacterium]
MSNLFSILDMGKRTMQAYQSALQTSSQNISSAGDPKYHRQVAVIRPTPGMPYRGPSAFSRAIQLGTGVSLNSITRRRDVFVENQIRQVDQRLGRLESEELGLSRLEVIFNEFSGSSSFNSTLSEFFNAWEALAQEPPNPAFRAELRVKGEALAGDLRSAYEELELIQGGFAEDIQIRIDRVNSLLEQLAEVHRDIGRSKVGPFAAHDLMDLRDSVVSEIADLTDIRVFEDTDGTVSLFLGGVAIIRREEVNKLQVVSKESEGGSIQLSKVVVSRIRRLSDVQIKAGAIGGLLNVQDEIIPDLMKNLDEVAYRLSREINVAHQNGTGLDGESGRSFFQFNLPSGAVVSGTEEVLLEAPVRAAATIALTGDIKTNLNNIAAGQSGARGDNSAANQIVQVRDKLLFADDTLNVFDFYNSSVVTFGGRTQANARQLNSAELIREQLESRYQDISGVSIDEELVDILIAQSVFQAAARLMTTIDGMTDTVINRMAPR